MKVKLLKDVAIGQGEHQAGKIIDVDNGIGESLLGTGWAERVVEDKKEIKPKLETVKHGS